MGTRSSSFRSFLNDPSWDAPFFKRLARNDTPEAPGHQSGVVLPKSLRQYLPTLNASATSRAIPTADRRLQAEMFVGMERVAENDLRYQIQTWGGTRPPEGRVTDGLGPLRDRSGTDDILIFQRSAESLERFRLILVRQEADEYPAVDSMAGIRRWGPLIESEPPVSQDALTLANSEMEAVAQGPFQSQRSVVQRTESRQTRIARNAAFRERVRLEYGGRCAISGIAILAPSGRREVESAHVVPVGERGVDDVRNGLALTRTLHWAFDRGLLGVLPKRVVYVPKQVRELAENSFLAKFNGRPICEARTAALRVHPDALDWHYENRVRKWD